MKDVRFEFYIGDTYTRDFTIEGYTDVISDVYFTVKNADDDKHFLLQKQLDNGITLTDVQYEEDGETIKSRTYNLLLNWSDTEPLKADTEYPFDIEIITPRLGSEGIKKTIIKGIVLLNSATTRAWDE